MKHIERKISGSTGAELYYQCWEPQESSRGLLLVIHGAGEHSGRYSALAEFFTGQGFVVAALDQWGHGRSQGEPGYVERFSNYVDDLAAWHNEVITHYRDKPCFLMGHSLGGLVTALYLLRRPSPLAGCVLSGPLVMVEPDPGAIQRLAVRILGTLLPRLGVLKLDPVGVSRDPEVVSAYRLDPLVYHGRLKARMLREMFAAMDSLRHDAGNIDQPLLLLHGAADRLTSPAGSRYLDEHVGSRDHTLVIYPRLFHEILNEPERAEVLATILAWIEARMAGAGR